MKTHLTTLHNGGRTCAKTMPVAARKPVLALLMRLLWAAALVLPAFGAQAAVVFTNLYSFGSVLDTNGVALDGATPLAGLVQGSDGYFYGTTEFGGTNGLAYGGAGTVFRISTDGALTSLYCFTDGDDGYFPQAGLVQGTDGYFYGTTQYGAIGYGTVFKISTNGALTCLYSFTGGSDGSAYPSGLVQGTDGNFYGTTQWGGNTNLNDGYGYGTVFKISSTGALTSLYSFTGGDDGGSPQAGLVQGSDGNFYGTTQGGGNTNLNGGYGYGTVFKISTNGALTSLYSFGSVQDTNGVGLDGAYPVAALVQGSDGNFYGTTYIGGMHDGEGTVFKISTNGTLTTLYSFTGGTDGARPVAALVQGSDGIFYGTTFGAGGGGEEGHGRPVNSTVFQITTNGMLTSLYSSFPLRSPSDFGYISTCQPNGLVQGSDGSLYGTTQGGGTNNLGNVFRLTIVPQPQLTLIPSGPYMILTWPTNYSGFTLQSTTNLGSSAVWSTNCSPPVVIGGDNVVINTTTSGKQQFYRLSQ